MDDSSDCVAKEDSSAGPIYGGGALDGVLGKYLGSSGGFPETSE